MSNVIDELTLNLLINKNVLERLNKQNSESIDSKKKQEMVDYERRIKNLFNNLYDNCLPSDLSIDVKNSFTLFIEKSIYYLKTHDGFEKLENECSNNNDMEIKDDIDYEKEENDIMNGNYSEYNDDQYELEKDEEMSDNDNIKEEVIEKYKEKTFSDEVDEIKSPQINWFNYSNKGREMYKILPRINKNNTEDNDII